MKIIDRLVVNHKAPEDTHVIWINTQNPYKPTPYIYIWGQWRPICCGCGGSSKEGSFNNSFSVAFDIKM